MFQVILKGLEKSLGVYGPMNLIKDSQPTTHLTLTKL